MGHSIPLYKAELKPYDITEAAAWVASKGTYTRGPTVRMFEEGLNRLTGMEAVATSNGTTSLHLAIRAMHWRPGDKIITSPLSFIATTNVPLQEGLHPIFGRVGNNLQLDMKQAYEIIDSDPSVKGIVVPHIYGHEVDTDAMHAIKSDFPHIRIVEDAAQAFAEKDRGLGVGDASDAVAHSFHENKVITTLGEGGAALFHDPVMVAESISAREQGRIDSPDWLDHIEIGFNYRITELQAAVGIMQLDSLGAILDAREKRALQMIQLLQDENLPIELPEIVRRSWFGFYAIAKNETDAKSIHTSLTNANIGSRHRPIPAIGEFAHVRKSDHTNLSEGTEQIDRRIVSLPLYSSLTDNEIDRIVNEVTKAARATDRLASRIFYDKLADSYGETREARNTYLRAIEDYAVMAISDLPGESILDIGCGDGVRGRRIASATNRSIVQIDASSAMIKKARVANPNAFVLDISTQDPDKIPHSDTALMLWNVLGHIDKTNRLTALRNIHKALPKDGALILDVNNLFNSTQYGKDNVSRNRQAVQDSTSEEVGDFTTTHKINGTDVRTVTHIFHTSEIVNLLTEAGFDPDISYVNYETGEMTSEDDGQIFIVARKRTEQ